MPFSKDLNLISPPSLATAGLIFVSKTSLIFEIVSLSSDFFSTSINLNSLLAFLSCTMGKG